MISFGEVPASSVLPIPFDSFAGSTGASITITGLATSDIKVYKGTSMTERSSTAGFVLMDTDGIDLDGITGIQGFSIDLSDNTDAGFYATGSFFWVVISSITVDTQTVNFLAATFRIKAAEAVAGYPAVDTTKWLGKTIPTANVDGIPLVDLKYTLGTISPATAGSVRADSVTGAVGSVTGLTASNLDVAVSTRLATSSYTAPPSAATIAAAVWGGTGDGSYTYAQMLGYSFAFAAGTLSGVSANNPVFVSKGLGFTITAVQGADGRSSVTLS